MNAIRTRTRIVTVGVDGSLESRRAVTWAIDHASPGDTVELLHVWRRTPVIMPSELMSADDHAAARLLIDNELSHARAIAAGSGIRVVGRAVEGDVGEVLATEPTDEVVIGGCHHSLLSRVVFRPVAAHLVAHSNTPVTIVPMNQGD